jgi:hypothetical protein
MPLPSSPCPKQGRDQHSGSCRCPLCCPRRSRERAKSGARRETRAGAELGGPRIVRTPDTRGRTPTALRHCDRGWRRTVRGDVAGVLSRFRAGGRNIRRGDVEAIDLVHPGRTRGTRLADGDHGRREVIHRRGVVSLSCTPDHSARCLSALGWRLVDVAGATARAESRVPRRIAEDANENSCASLCDVSSPRAGAKSVSNGRCIW